MIETYNNQYKQYWQGKEKILKGIIFYSWEIVQDSLAWFSPWDRKESDMT